MMQNRYYTGEEKCPSLTLDNEWSVHFDGDLLLQDPEEIDAKTLRGHKGKIIDLISLNQTEFMSVDDDNVMIVWSQKGKKLGTLKSDVKINGISILNEYELLILGDDESISLWNYADYKKTTTFDTKTSSFGKVELDQGYFSIKNINGNLDVYRSGGEKIITFKNQISFFEAWRVFDNGCWLTSTQNNTKTLWSSDGEKINNINVDFLFNRDLLTIDDDFFAVADSNGNHVYVYDFKGVKHSSYKYNEGLLEDTKLFIQVTEDLKKSIENENDLQEFPHVNHPGAKKAYAPLSVENDNSIELDKEDNQYLWNFFNRPLFRPIYAQLKKEEKSVKLFRKSMHEKKQKDEETLETVRVDIQKVTGKKKVLGIITLIFLAVAVAAGGLIYFKTAVPNIELVAGVGGAIFALFAFLWFGKRNALKALLEEEKQLISKILTLDIFMPKTVQWLKEAKKYRDSLIKQIPVLNEPALYSGNKAKAIIKKVIADKIEKVALIECGLVKEDIIYVDVNGSNEKEAIVLHDWSLIQDKSDEPMTKNIINHNEMSFWSTKNEGMLFAVQYIQFIFLTKDKIDVFNTYYDFITDTYISKQARAYYYKDVTNMSKKEVERVVFSEENGYSATEITLQVSSGDRINLTIISPETMKNLHAQFNATEEYEDRKEEILELIEKRDEIVNDDSLSEEDKNDELMSINGRINALESDEIVISEEQNAKRTKADQTIQNIRTQVRNHKVSGEDNLSAAAAMIPDATVETLVSDVDDDGIL